MRIAFLCKPSSMHWNFSNERHSKMPPSMNLCPGGKCGLNVQRPRCPSISLIIRIENKINLLQRIAALEYTVDDLQAPVDWYGCIYHMTRKHKDLQFLEVMEHWERQFLWDEQ